uniref:CD44 n=1 Tax=Prolemur simus TaxID=1328070 RepID=A0A8C9DVE7_PROSS
MWSWFGNFQPKTQDLTTAATTALMSSSATTPETATKRQETQDWFSWWFQPSESRNHLHTTTQTAGTDSNTISAGWEPNEENEDERDKHVSFSGSGIDDDEDFISSTISTTPRVFDHTKQNQDWTQWNPSHSNPELLLQTTTRMTDVDRSVSNAHGENWTQKPHPPLIHPEHDDKEETPHSTSTIQATPSSTTEETATQREQWFGNGGPGEYPQTPKEDSHPAAGTAASTYTNHPSQRMTTQSQQDSSWTDFLDPISHPMGHGHQTERRKDTDSSHSTTPQPTADPNTGLVEELDRTGPLSMTTRVILRASLHQMEAWKKTKTIQQLLLQQQAVRIIKPGWLQLLIKINKLWVLLQCLWWRCISWLLLCCYF